MSDAIEFLKSMQNDARAKEIVREMKTPENEKQAADAYVSLARAMGYNLNREEIVSAARELSRSQRAKTDTTMDKISLDDNDLDHVAGGAPGDEYEICSTTFKEGEWCWWNDSCDLLITDYFDDLDDEGEMEFSPDDISRGKHFSGIPDDLTWDNDLSLE